RRGRLRAPGSGDFGGSVVARTSCVCWADVIRPRLQSNQSSKLAIEKVSSSRRLPATACWVGGTELQEMVPGSHSGSARRAAEQIHQGGERSLNPIQVPAKAAIEEAAR